MSESVRGKWLLGRREILFAPGETRQFVPRARGATRPRETSDLSTKLGCVGLPAARVISSLVSRRIGCWRETIRRSCSRGQGSSLVAATDLTDMVADPDNGRQEKAGSWEPKSAQRAPYLHMCL